MNDALYVAATGMKSQNAQLQTVAGNVANMNTPGYKRVEQSFAALVQPAVVRQEAADAPPMAAATVAGVQVQGVHIQWQQGALKPTGDARDLAIDGPGFLEVSSPEGQSLLVRGGRWEVTEDGWLGLQGLGPLRQRLSVPTDAQALTVEPSGLVSVLDASGHRRELGRLELAMPARVSELQPVGHGAYALPAGQSASPVSVVAQTQGAGRLVQGSQEASNVALVDEMVQLMMAQRAYEMSVKVVQAADELAGMANDLRKS